MASAAHRCAAEHRLRITALWDVVLDAWEEVAHSEGYAATLVESLPRRMQMGD
jgi:hypothetical protein